MMISQFSNSNPESPIRNPRCEKLANKLISSGQNTRDFFQAIEGNDWYQQVYTDGANWSVHHILAHFVASETSVTRLVKFILRGNEGVPEGFDIGPYLNAEKEAKKARRGMWVLGDKYKSPSKWRKLHKAD